jgi:hypothetical protein
MSEAACSRPKPCPGSDRIESRSALRYFESPDWFDSHGPSIYLAGGISGCPDWQSRVTESLRELPIAVLNPRQASYPGGDRAFRAQVEWEYYHIHRADVMLFWFPAASLQPIVWYELGTVVSTRDSRICVGAEPGYARRFDLEVQLSLAHPTLKINSILGSVIDEAVNLLGGI